MTSDCPGLPWDSRAIAGTHSAFSGVLAGFALAAFFLLVEHARKRDSETVHDVYVQAMLLLFVAFVAGSLSSFLFSTIVGDPCKVAFYGFSLASAVFVFNVFVLLLGLIVVFRALGIGPVLDLARRIGYIVIAFAVFRMWDDFLQMSTVFATNTKMMSLTIAAVLPPVAALLARRLGRFQQWIEHRSLYAFCYLVPIFSFLIAAMQGFQVADAIAQGQVVLQSWLPLLLMVVVSGMGAWTVILAPARPVEAASKNDEAIAEQTSKESNVAEAY